MRLFVAADLPDEALTAIEEWQAAELERHEVLRVVHTLHVTLCFLGAVPQRLVGEIQHVLAATDVPPLPAAVCGPVFLPERGRKHVLALRLEDPSENIRRLQHELAEALVSLKVYKPEKRPYLPHITVARFRRPGDEFPLQNVNIDRFGLPQVTLYNSALERGGAVHTPLASFPAG